MRFLWMMMALLCAGSLAEASKRPSFLIILTDEETRIPHGWEEVLEPWYEEHLPGHTLMKQLGVEFTHHKIASSACTPSRSALYTGQYPSVTGITQTYGFAKDYDDPELKWLEPYTFPTLGNWFCAGGYKPENVCYIGKFHIADVDLRDEQGEIIQTKTLDGENIPENIAVYHEKHPLAPFGFSDHWVGPDPHGIEVINTGKYRDPDFVQQALDLIEEKAMKFEEGDEEPFVFVVNLVNPHDISLSFMNYWQDSFPEDDDVPALPVCVETDELDLSSQPAVHQAWKEAYPRMIAWDTMTNSLFNTDEGREKMRKFYYHLLKEVDQGIFEILQALISSPLYDDTYVVMTSDHGDLLGRRGGQWQKWHSLNREVVDVPLFIAHPSFQEWSLEERCKQTFTSHVDLLPTLLSLAQVNVEEAREQLSKDFSKALPLVGKDFSPLLDPTTEDLEAVVYCRTDDEITRGEDNVNKLALARLPTWLVPWVPGISFSPVEGTEHVESLHLYWEGQEYSFHHYFDPRGEYPDEWALYNLTNDGYEVKDLKLADPETFAELFPIFLRQMEEQRSRIEEHS